jgi:hypothetical protein
VVGGAGVAVAEQHGDHEYVPGELQREVGSDEDVTAGCLDSGQDRVELEVADQLGDRVRRVLARRRRSRVLVVSGRGDRSYIDPAQVPQHQPHAVGGGVSAAAGREHRRQAAADPAGEVLRYGGRVGGGDHQVEVGPAVDGRCRAAGRAVHPQTADPGVFGGQPGQRWQGALLPALTELPGH